MRPEILGPVEEIAEQHDLARALEWMMMTIPYKQAGWSITEDSDLDEMVRMSSGITDPENRARAQCRLAFAAPERLDDLLRAAVESVDQIVDPGRKAETISEIRAVLGGVPQHLGL